MDVGKRMNLYLTLSNVVNRFDAVEELVLHLGETKCHFLWKVKQRLETLQFIAKVHCLAEAIVFQRVGLHFVAICQKRW